MDGRSASALTINSLPIVTVFNASIGSARSVILYLTASTAPRFHGLSYRRISAVVNTAVVYGTCFKMCVDRFHDIPNVTPGLLNVDDSGVLEAGSFDE